MAAPPAPPGAPRVLIVDDSIVVRKVLVMTVRQLPELMEAAIEEAGNGAIALKLLESGRYDLVLSDVRMPLVDGLELVRHVRERMNDRETPIVLITTLGTEEDRQRGLAAGATAYVVKPLSPYLIKIALREILDRGALRKNPSAATSTGPGSGSSRPSR